MVAPKVYFHSISSDEALKKFEEKNPDYIPDARQIVIHDEKMYLMITDGEHKYNECPRVYLSKAPFRFADTDTCFEEIYTELDILNSYKKLRETSINHEIDLIKRTCDQHNGIFRDISDIIDRENKRLEYLEVREETMTESLVELKIDNMEMQKKIKYMFAAILFLFMMLVIFFIVAIV